MPVVEHPLPVWVQVPLHTVLVPQAVPDGLKVQPWVIVIGLAVTHWPEPLQVREVVVTICVPAVLQPALDCVQAPVIIVVPQSRPFGL